jgi:hypothetical protein
MRSTAASRSIVSVLVSPALGITSSTKEKAIAEDDIPNNGYWLRVF